MIVDTSGSISRRNFKRLIEFIEDMLDGFDISEHGTHVAVVEYSTKPSVQLRFDDFSGAMLNAANLKRKVRKIPHSRGYTYIDKALQLANTDVFSAKGGMRPNVTKVSKEGLFFFLYRSALRWNCISLGLTWAAPFFFVHKLPSTYLVRP